MTAYPKMGVVRVTWPTFLTLGSIMSSKRVKLGHSNLVYKLTWTSSNSTCMIDYPQRYAFRISSPVYFRKITNNTSETLQDTDIVTSRLIGNHIWPIEWQQWQWGGLLYPFRGVGLGPRLTQCGMGRGLYFVPSGINLSSRLTTIGMGRKLGG